MHTPGNQRTDSIQQRAGFASGAAYHHWFDISIEERIQEPTPALRAFMANAKPAIQRALQISEHN